MTLGERIKTAREKAGLTQKRLAELIGAKHNSISNWENDQNKPDIDYIETLLGALNVTPAYLLGLEQDYKKEKPTTLSSDGFTLSLNELQSEYVGKYSELDEEGRDRVHNAIDYEIAKQRERQKPETVTLIEPSLPVCAGTGNYLDDDIEYEERTVIKNKYTYGATYIIKLQGDSMEPEFHDEDRLIVTDARGQSPILGRVGIFIINGDAIFRQPLKDVLHPYNPKYQDIVPTEFDDVRYVGYVVGILDDSWVIE